VQGRPGVAVAGERYGRRQRVATASSLQRRGIAAGRRQIDEIRGWRARETGLDSTWIRLHCSRPRLGRLDFLVQDRNQDSYPVHTVMGVDTAGVRGVKLPTI
jgi:hypothetical protein